MQEVFQSWAKIWRGKMTPQVRKTLIAYDPHAPRELRTNVTAQSIDDFIQLLILRLAMACGLILKNEYIFGN